MWQYRSTNELYHHGVIGMKWHNHKTKAANRAIDMRETLQKNNKNAYDNMTRDAKSRYANNTKKLNKVNARNKALYDSTDVINKYAIAKQKAKLDKNYKNSKEYNTTKKAFNKKLADDFIYGPNGHIRIETLKNQGYSEKQAKGRIMIKQFIGGAAVGAASTMYFLKTR